MDVQDTPGCGTPSECHQQPLDSPGTGNPTTGRRVRTPEDRGASRKRRRLSRSSSSSSTTSSLAKVSRLSRDRDTFDVDAGYENDADDDDDDEDDGDDEDEYETVVGDTVEDEDDEGRTKSGQHVLPTGKDASRHNPDSDRAGVRALASAVDGGGSCGEKNGEKSTPFGTADLNAPNQPHQLHQHQQHPATNYQHYQQQQQHGLRHNKRPKYDYTRDQMFEIFQPWVIRTYGDRAKTKTITLKKQARIIKTLGGLEMNNPDSSKFRFWVKTKGFTTSKPGNFQDIFTHQNIPENDGCMLYAPSGGLEPGQPYKKVAVVENFFDIIYGVHVSLGSRATRHAGQKRTYRTITETYAFLPREAVTKFLSLCSQCSKLTTKVYSPKSEHKLTPRVDAVVTSKRTFSERFSRTCGGVESKCNKTTDRTQSSLRYYELLRNLYENGKSGGSRSVGELPASGKHVNLTSNGANINSASGSVRMPRPGSVVSEVLRNDCVTVADDGNERGTVCASERGSARERLPVVGLNNNRSEKGDDEKGRTVPITSTYLDVTRSFGLEDDDALNMVSLFYYFYGYFSMQRLYNQ
uniref:Nucleolar protein 4 n=1 Tax=Anopheles funestus TaxID=62324 RepID=A0A182RCN8_ANOFN